MMSQVTTPEFIGWVKYLHVKSQDWSGNYTCFSIFSFLCSVL